MQLKSIMKCTFGYLLILGAVAGTALADVVGVPEVDPGMMDRRRAIDGRLSHPFFPTP